MIRRQIRQRKEYLYKKALQEKASERQQDVEALKSALEAGRAIPKQLTEKVGAAQNSYFYDEDLSTPSSAVDDEYSLAGLSDPKILITTSRDPSSRLQTFAKELKLVFPNSQRINRGNHVLSTVVSVCRSNAVTDLIIVHEHRGVPDGLIVSHFPHGPTAYFSLSNVVLRHDIASELGHVSEVYPHLIFNNFNTKVGKRVASILKYLFPVPKEDAKRLMTFSNQDDFISFRQHSYSVDGQDVELKEIGPRFEMKPFEIRLGLADFDQADKEWVLRPYTNSARKKSIL